ncbi:MAG: SprB repeat-containing protein, partial [Salinivirgaceae bacterium]|nr:SprB repeat-containing protein [Salinivirgaceae bacterium]
NMPLTYTIAAGDFNADGNFTGLSQGDYIVTITDASGCPQAVTGTLTVNQPSPGPFTHDSTFVQHVICHGGNDGVVRMYVSGGTLPYEFRMTSPVLGAWQSSNEFSGLSGGSYEFEMRDATGTPVHETGKTNIIDPTQLVINNITRDHNTCDYDLGGEITITASGGHSPLSYSINNGGDYYSTNEFLNLPNGTYNIKVKDNLGCIVSSTPQIISSMSNGLLVSGVVITHITSCYGEVEGELEIAASGGFGNYIYSINGTDYFSNGGDFAPLASGTYPVSVQDDMGCQASWPDVTINQPDEIVFSTSEAHVTGCHGDNTGSITINAVGGTGSLSYSIDGGSVFQAGNVFAGLVAGTYNIIVKDDNDCQKTGSVEITQPDLISITSETFTQITCNGLNDGTVTIEATGGTAPLTYTITGGVSNNTGVFANLSAGTYQVSVTDVNACAAVQSSPFVITNPNAISITNEVYTDITCNGLANGSITIAGAGGTGVLTYTITGGASNTTGVFTDLSAGNYQVTVSDVNGCPEAISLNYTISNPDVISITGESYTDITCNGLDNGTVTVTATGGTAPLTYTITGG